MATSTGKATDLRQIAEAYFGALREGGLDRVPWAEDVLFRGPLAPENPLRGRKAVEAFLGPLAGNLGDVQIEELFFGPNGDSMAVAAIVGPLRVLDRFHVRDGRIVHQENYYDPRPVLDAPAPGGLTAFERALLLEQLETSRDRLSRFLTSASKDVLERRPPDGGWTPLECAEHLVLSEEGLLGLIRTQILTGPADASLPLQLQGRDSAVVEAMRDRTNKARTFDFLIPQARYSTAAGVLDAFLARRAATMDFVRASRDAVHFHASALPGLGPLDAYHWLLLMAGHTDRHVEQMTAVA